MKSIIHLTLILSLLLFGCSKDQNLDVTPEVLDDGVPEIAEVGYDFRHVPWDYERHIDGIQYVNKAGTVNKVGGQHWTFRSPSLAGQEIGFSVVLDDRCQDEPCEVVVFLHGSHQNENAGAARFYDYYKDRHADKPKAFIFPNGILAEAGSPISTSVWRVRYNRTTRDTFDTMKTVWELIGAIMERDTLFPAMNKKPEKWSVVGFSAGASGAMAVAHSPLYNSSPYQPKNIYPLGGFIHRGSIEKFYDLNAGLPLVSNCAPDLNRLWITNHIQDNVNCAGFTTYENTRPFALELQSLNVPMNFLGILKRRQGLCEEGSDNNKSHNVAFYMQNLVGDCEQITSCSDQVKDDSLQIGDYIFE